MSFENFGKFLRTSRINASKTQDQVAKELGFKNGQFVSNMDRGICSLPVKNIETLGECLDVSANSIRMAMLRDYKNKIGL